MNPRASSLPGQNQNSVTHDDHVAPWLLSMFTTQQAVPRLTAEGSRWAVEHLQACEPCRAEISVLVSMATASSDIPPTLSALLAHISLGSTQVTSTALVPDDEDLAMYVALLETQGMETAQQQFPDLFTHVKVCLICQAEVNSVRKVLVEDQSDPAAWQTIWEIPNAWERRLRVPYQVWVRPRALHITSTLVDSQIETPQGRGDPLSGERFTVVLCENPALAQEARVSVQIEMHALYAQRITGHIHATRTFPNASSVSADGISWRLEPTSPSQLEAPTRSGETDGKGTATFSIHGMGDYRFIFTVAGRDWIVPLAIRTDVSHDESGL